MANKRKCKQCKEYTRDGVKHPSGYFCSQDHAIEFARANAEKARAKQVENKRKAFNRETRERKQRIKSRGDWLREAQMAFNKWIRLRDGDNPCISCLRFHDGQYHAGHYKTVGGNPELRFDERNCHKQCSACNNHLSGNIVNYRINLIDKVGIEVVRELEGPHDPKKYTIEDIKAIKAKYQRKVKEMESD